MRVISDGEDWHDGKEFTQVTEEIHFELREDLKGNKI